MGDIALTQAKTDGTQLTQHIHCELNIKYSGN